MPRLFGTDGIRGVFNCFPLDLQTITDLGVALPEVIRMQSSFQNSRRLRILVGRDTRLSGKILENALTAGLCSSGADVYLLGVVPTAVIAFATTALQADGGVMITASHNSAENNGIKLFSFDGFKFTELVERELEARVLQPISQLHRKSDVLGGIHTMAHFEKSYFNYLIKTFKNSLDLSGFKIALDCAHGAQYRCGPAFLRGLGAVVFCIGNKPDGMNINDQCGSLFPIAVAKLTTTTGALIGITVDGDGDRCILSDEKGNIVTGDEIFGIISLWMNENGSLKQSTAVTTQVANMGLEHSLEPYGIRLIKTPVGDRSVTEAMRKFGLNFGGEPSGHFVFLDHFTTGDGLVTALQMIKIMQMTRQPLSELRKSIRLWPQVLESVRVTQKKPFNESLEISRAIASTEESLRGRGRVFVRYSGTEPVVRILVEGEDLFEIRRLSQQLIFSIQSELGIETPMTATQFSA